MPFEHTVLIASTPEGFLPSCVCGWRSPQFVTYDKALKLCDKHELQARTGRLNLGPRQPTLKTTARMFRENAENAVYTADERVMWDMLATEAEDELAARSNAPLPGQQQLPFD